jgi:DNA-binding HxlR family transcriptional regulator
VVDVYLDHLRELDELFEHRGDATVLVCLAHGIDAAKGRPLHFRELVRTTVERSRGYVPEGKISRLLRHLQRSGYVAGHDEDSRHPSYSLTPLGEQKANVLVFLLEALENRDNQQPPEPDEPPSDPDAPVDPADE